MLTNIRLFVHESQEVAWFLDEGANQTPKHGNVTSENLTGLTVFLTRSDGSGCHVCGSLLEDVLPAASIGVRHMSLVLGSQVHLTQRPIGHQYKRYEMRIIIS